MIQINKTTSPNFNAVARTTINPYKSSADIDPYNIFSSIEKLLSEENRFVFKLNNNEKAILEKFNAKIATDESYKAPSNVITPEQMYKEQRLKEDIEAYNKKVASIKQARAKEESIKNEATFVSAYDKKSALDKADNIKGIITAKKLDTDKKDISIRDLMGDNKFIEDNLKKSKISSVMASQEGWSNPVTTGEETNTKEVTEVQPEVSEEKKSKKSKRRSK